MERFLQAETLIIELLLVVSLVAIAVQRLRVPYTVALVVVGLLLTFQSPLELDLTPELILALFVPPLVFEAAFHINFAELRRLLPRILLLAVPGVILTMMGVGAILAWTTSLSLSAALVFGALIAATDPVAVVALFRSLGVPKRLAVLVEGESLLNDGTAIVVFNLMLVLALGGEFRLVNAAADFVRVAAGGVVIGLALGWAVSRLIARVDDYLIETTLTTVLAFGVYLLAERLHFSGVLAVVTAGVVNGNMGPQGMSPTTRIVLFNFWEYVAFLANSLVFLLIGLEVNIPALAADWQPILVAVVAVLAMRAIVVYGLMWVGNRFTQPMPFRWQHILGWGGLRGAISLALVLSLPAGLGAERELLRVMAFGVVLFTLLGQATTMRPLVRWLKVVTRSEAQMEYELRHARLASLRAAEAHVSRMHVDGLISTPTWERLQPHISERAAALSQGVREVLQAAPALEAEELDTGWREFLRAQKSALHGLRRDGVISEESFERLTADVDTQLDSASFELPAAAESATEFFDVKLTAESFAAGKTVADLGLPRAAVLVSIQREDALLIPRGDTHLQVGDVLTLLAEREHVADVMRLLGSLTGKNRRYADPTGTTAR